MKICLLAPANNPHTQKIAYTLHDKGYDICVFTFHPASLLNIHTVYFPPLVKPLGKINYLLQSERMKHHLDRLKPDILHAHYVSSYGVAGCLTRYQPFVVSVWGKDIYDAPENPVLGYLIKKSLSKADYVLSTSKAMAKRTKQFVNKEIIVTPFGIDLTKFHPRGKRPGANLVIGTARGLMPKYGIDYLIKAFSNIVKKIHDAELHIAGTGPQSSELIALTRSLGIESMVKFHGFIDPGQMPQFLSLLDIFVMPSISESESFGVAALEAQACGLPVIASDIGGLRETVVDTKTGFLVPPGDVDAIVDKLSFFYQQKDQLISFGKAGFKFVEDNYNWKENIKIIEKIYDKASSHGRK